MKYIVYGAVGIALYAHAGYQMYQRANKQDVGGAADEVSAANFLSLTYLLAVAECLAGFAIIIYSSILKNEFIPSRLIDKFACSRYDATLKPSVGFIHFQHRGVVGDGRHYYPHKELSRGSAQRVD